MQRLKKKNSAQTILELFFALLALSFFFAINFFFFTVFDVSQKQLILTRAQAFLELGDHANFGLTQQGASTPQDRGKPLVFNLGEKTKGAIVNLDKIKSFEKAVKGNMQLDGVLSTSGDNYWMQYHFPKGHVKLASYAALAKRTGNGKSLLAQFDLHQTLSIVRNHNINLKQDVTNSLGGKNQTGMYSGSINYFDWSNNVANIKLTAKKGLEDNTHILREKLRQVAKADPSLSDEAKKLESSVNLADSVQGGAESSLISLAIQLAMQAGMKALGKLFPPSDGSTPMTEGGGQVQDAANTAGSESSGFKIPGLGDFQLPSLEEGDTLGNISKLSSFSSDVLNTANMGFHLAGKDIKGLDFASQATGALAGFTGGISNFQNATSAGQGFNAAGEFVGGLGQGVGLADQNAGQILGTASAGLGFAGSLSNLNDAFQNGSVWKNADGTWKDGASWQAASAVGSTLGKAGGIVNSVAPGSMAGAGMSLAGGAIANAGSLGSMGYDLKQGTYDGKSFQFMSAAGSLAASVSQTGATAAKLTGNEKLAGSFGYGELIGGATAVVGMVGNMAKDAVEGIAKAIKSSQSKTQTAQANSSSGSSSSSSSSKTNTTSAPTAATKQTTGASSNQTPSSGASPAGGTSTSSVASTPKLEGFAKLNHDFQSAERANKTAQFAFQIANTVKSMTMGASEALNHSGANGFRQTLNHTSGDPMTVLQVATRQLNDLASQISTKIPPARFAEYQKYMKQIQAAKDELKKPEGKRDMSIIQQGTIAANKANAVLEDSLGIPAPGTPERRAYNQNQYQQARGNVGQAYRTYQGELQNDRLAISTMLQAERYLEGRFIVEKNENVRQRIRELGQKNSDFLRRHREKYYAPDQEDYTRFKRAEFAWAHPVFMEPKQALKMIRKALEKREKKYHEVKSALVDALQATRQ